MIRKSRQMRIVSHRRLRVEQLEPRCLMSAEGLVEIMPFYVTATDDPINIETPLDAWTGVVRITYPFAGGTKLGSGVLLETRRHILTAAHVFNAGPTGDISVRFQDADQTDILPVPINRVYIHPDFDSSTDAATLRGFDIAILELTTDAPTYADAYPIARGPDGPIGHFRTTKVGYGLTGTGNNGTTPNTAGTRRNGFNRYDAFADTTPTFDLDFRGPPGTALAYDFDNGLAANDAFGRNGISDLGYGEFEVGSAPGDSGGPTLLDLAPSIVHPILGITSYGTLSDDATADVSPGLNSSFGEFAVDTNVSAFAGWIDALTTKSLVTGADAHQNGSPHVRVFDVDLLNTPHLVERSARHAYDPAFTGGVRVATADVNGDGTPDIVTAPGPGGGPHVRVFDGRNIQVQVPGPIGGFFAYDGAVTTGLSVAAGDVNGDGFADIMTAPGFGSGPHVRVFSGSNKSLLFEYMAYNELFGGGVQVALADVNQDGFTDMITGPGSGGGPHVRVRSGIAPDHPDLANFNAFVTPAGFTGGVNVAAGDVDGDGHPDIIVGRASGGDSLVRVFSGLNFSLLSEFTAFPGYSGATRVAATNATLDGKADIIVSTGPGQDQIRIFDMENLSAPILQDSPYPGFPGGVFVAGGLPMRLFRSLPEPGGGGGGGGGEGFALASAASLDRLATLSDPVVVELVSIDSDDPVAIRARSPIATESRGAHPHRTEAFQWDEETIQAESQDDLDELIWDLASQLVLDIRPAVFAG